MGIATTNIGGQIQPNNLGLFAGPDPRETLNHGRICGVCGAPSSKSEPLPSPMVQLLMVTSCTESVASRPPT